MAIPDRSFISPMNDDYTIRKCLSLALLATCYIYCGRPAVIERSGVTKPLNLSNVDQFCFFIGKDEWSNRGMDSMTYTGLSYGYKVPNYTAPAPALSNDGSVTQVDQTVMKAVIDLVSPSALNKTSYMTTQDVYNLGLMMPVSP